MEYHLFGFLEMGENSERTAEREDSTLVCACNNTPLDIGRSEVAWRSVGVNQKAGGLSR